MRRADVKPGDEIPPITRVPDAEQMKLMAALLRDPNPIHFDVESVRELGLGDRVVTQGPMTVSYIADTVAAWAGGTRALKSLQVRMLGMAHAGDPVTCSGTVTDVDSGTGVVTLLVEAAVEDRPLVAGTAAVQLE